MAYLCGILGRAVAPFRDGLVKLDLNKIKLDKNGV